MKILLVEDDARTADFILKGLQQSGYSTVHAATGPDGLFKAETEECDLAIVDIMLPGMDGFTLIEKLRADRITMPVIVLSAKNSVADKIRGLQNAMIIWSSRFRFPSWSRGFRRCCAGRDPARNLPR